MVPAATAAEVTGASVLEELRAAAIGARARPYEIPTSIMLDHDGPWTPQNGCRTSNGKLRRTAIAARAGLSTGGGEAPQSPLEQRAVRFLLSPSDTQAAAALPGALIEGTTLAMLGGDSIMASRVAEKLPSVGVRRIVSTPLSQLRREIVGGGDVAGSATMLASRGAPFWEYEVEPAVEAWGGLPGVDPASSKERIQSNQDAVLVTRSLDGAVTSSGGHEGAILVTGVTGFLGPHLLDALVADPILAGLTLYCLVRPPLERVRIPPGATSRVVCVAADLEAPDLGVTPADRAAIRRAGVVLIVHNGAAVDHTRAYSQLRVANVLAADALIALAATPASDRPPPAMVLVSSLSAITASDTHEELECTPPSRVDLLSGYGQSKWVSERRLASAFRAGYLSSLAVVRLGLIGPHSVTGEANMQDWLHLLLRAIVVIKAVPSFSDAGKGSRIECWVNPRSRQDAFGVALDRPNMCLPPSRRPRHRSASRGLRSSSARSNGVQCGPSCAWGGCPIRESGGGPP